jgi:antitoxin MazE
MGMMKVSRWGNSLAIRLPVELVRELDVKEGDYVEHDRLALRRSPAKMTRDEALAAIKTMRQKMPTDWKLDRNDPDMRG